MPVDPWPDEPKETNPEDRWGNPERELVENITIDAEPEFSGDEVPTEAVSADGSRQFWASVVLANIAVFALSLGPMLIYFRGQWTLGLGLVVGGVVVVGRIYSLFREFKDKSDEEHGDDSNDSNDRGDSDDSDDAEPAGSSTATTERNS